MAPKSPHAAGSVTDCIDWMRSSNGSGCIMNAFMSESFSDISDGSAVICVV